METNKIYEIDGSSFPGGKNMFEVYRDFDIAIPWEFQIPIIVTESLIDACLYCYNKGVNFEVYTLAQYYEEELSNTPVRT